MRPDILIFFVIALAIVCYSPIGKVFADILKAAFLTEQSNNELTALKNKYDQLEAKVNDYENELLKVRESIIYYDEKLKTQANGPDEKLKKLNELKKKELS